MVAVCFWTRVPNQGASFPTLGVCHIVCCAVEARGHVIVHRTLHIAHCSLHTGNVQCAMTQWDNGTMGNGNGQWGMAQWPLSLLQSLDSARDLLLSQRPSCHNAIVRCPEYCSVYGAPSQFFQHYRISHHRPRGLSDYFTSSHSQLLNSQCPLQGLDD